MHLDPTTIHNDNIGAVVGSFYDTEIREVDMLAVDLRCELESQRAARLSLGEESAPIELLPGETIVDCRVRRTTTSEVIGEKFYEDKPQVAFEESISGLMPPDYWDDYETRRV